MLITPSNIGSIVDVKPSNRPLRKAPRAGNSSPIPWMIPWIIRLPASMKSGAHSLRHSMILETHTAAACAISGAPSARPSAIFPTNTIAVVQISSAHSKSPVTRAVIRLDAASPIPGLLFSESQNEPTRPTAASISLGAAPAASSTIWVKTPPNVVTRLSSPPSLKASWSCWIISCAVFTTSMHGVCIFSYMEIPNPSKPDFKIVICPCRLLFMVSAILAAAPSQL